MPGIAFMYINLAISTFVFKVGFLPASVKRNIIYINTNNISVEQFCFYEGSAAARKLIEN